MQQDVNREMEQRVKARLTEALPFAPTAGQQRFISAFSAFSSSGRQGIFVLKGYAGTGKTTMLSALASTFKNVVLLAPTGRAAKVLSGYTGKSAFTIHKHLYMPAMARDGRIFLRLMENKYKRTLFIIDEASMIPDASIDDPASPFPGVNLLSDLISYVFSAPGCSMLLVGDTAQLPPVHFSTSPALDPNHLRFRYRYDVQMVELTEVVRQQQESGILSNATELRTQIGTDKKWPAFHLSGYNDIQRMSAVELGEKLHDLYREYGSDQVLVITRSNRSAIQYNRMIRHQQMWQEEEINAGDSLMVVKNNYHWLPDDHPAGFIANGEIVEVKKIVRFEERHGFRFALASLVLQDADDQPPFEAYVILDTLASEAPALTQEDSKKLYESIHASYEEEEPDKGRRNAMVRKDPYYNALQIKFSYAITCHKAQGGQWDAVLVDQGYMTEEQAGDEWLRWLYTAITRAKKELYLVNFEDRFFEFRR